MTRGVAAGRPLLLLPLALFIAAPAGAETLADERERLAEERAELAEQRERLAQERAELEARRRAVEQAEQERQTKRDEQEERDRQEKERQDDEDEDQDQEPSGGGPNLAAIGTIATAATGVVAGLGVVVASLLSVPNPLLYGGYRAQLQVAQANYAIDPRLAHVRSAQAARAEMRAIEDGLVNQAGVLIGAGATLVPAAISLGIGVFQLWSE